MCYPSTAKVWQTLNIGKSSRIPNNLIISGVVHGQMPGHCLGVVCQTLPVLRYKDATCVATQTLHLDRLGQLGEFEQDSNTDSERPSNTDSCSARHAARWQQLELTELAKPVEMPCLCCNTQHDDSAIMARCSDGLHAVLMACSATIHGGTRRKGTAKQSETGIECVRCGSREPRPP